MTKYLSILLIVSTTLLGLDEFQTRWELEKNGNKVHVVVVKNMAIWERPISFLEKLFSKGISSKTALLLGQSSLLESTGTFFSDPKILDSMPLMGKLLPIAKSRNSSNDPLAVHLAKANNNESLNNLNVIWCYCHSKTFDFLYTRAFFRSYQDVLDVISTLDIHATLDAINREYGKLARATFSSNNRYNSFLQDNLSFILYSIDRFEKLYGDQSHIIYSEFINDLLASDDFPHQDDDWQPSLNEVKLMHLRDIEWACEMHYYILALDRALETNDTIVCPYNFGTMINKYLKSLGATNISSSTDIHPI